MKKTFCFFIVGTALLALSGCSASENFLEQQISERSGIYDESDYQDYQRMKDGGKLGDDGFYSPPPSEQDSQPTEKSGTIHVTFAKNSFLNITYYSDPELKKLIDEKNCYLNPGDHVYASEPQIDNPYSSEYVFVRFRIWSCDSPAKRESKDDELGGRDAHLVMAIPVGYSGTELAVEPIGKYQDRELTLKDDYIDSNGKAIELSGTWIIDGRETTSSALKVSPVTPFTVVYDYSQYINDFYFESSTPECFSESNGSVQFHEAQALDSNSNYAVRLHRYISVKVTNAASNIFDSAISTVTQSNSIIKSISVNGITQPFSADAERVFSQLKCGDQITIRVGRDYKVTVSGLDCGKPVDIDGGWEYTVTIPNTNETELSITVGKITATLGGYVQKTMQHATITVRGPDGNALQEGAEVNDNDKVSVTITPANGYYVTGKKVSDDIYQDTMKYSKYIASIDQIITDHPVQKFCQVTLNTDCQHGKCVFKLDGKEVNGPQALRLGQTLDVEYTLTDSGYEIERDGFISSVWGFFNKNNVTVSIEITEDMDGKEIRGEEYVNIKEN